LPTGPYNLFDLFDRLAKNGGMKMKISIDPVIVSRIQTAWAKLTPDQQNRITPLIMKAHQQAVTASRSREAPSPDASLARPLTLAFTAIRNDLDGVLNSLEAGVAIAVDGAGEIWGTGKYEQLDPGWLEAFAEWLEHLVSGGIHTFNTDPVTLKIPNNIQIGLAGDWATGDWRTPANPSPSADVLKHMSFLQSDLTIHLGDTYYAGTPDEEEHLLTKLWSRGNTIGSLALNSNHEMYSGGAAYFDAIGKPPFEIQKGCSYFALENDDWIIVGLDSAYYSDAETVYQNGALFRVGGPQDQLDFLKDQVEKGKKMIILTHHNGLVQDGSSRTDLWTQVMGAFPVDAAPTYWYWGHVHCGACYKPEKNGAAEVRCRCCGHGGLPCAEATEMAGKPNVVWYEKRLANDPEIPLRVLNGFAMLYLQGPKIDEVFYDENGGVAWP
jgi:Calcineurin-like phosphoesterase